MVRRGLQLAVAYERCLGTVAVRVAQVRTHGTNVGRSAMLGLRSTAALANCRRPESGPADRGAFQVR